MGSELLNVNPAMVEREAKAAAERVRKIKNERNKAKRLAHKALVVAWTSDGSDLSPEKVANVRTWIDKLRSGDYAQADGVLRGVSGFCCLGVACDLEFVPGRWVEHGQRAWRYLWKTNGATASSMPQIGILHDYYGLDETVSIDGVDGNERASDALAGMNDEGCSFRSIALVIEKALEEALARNAALRGTV